MKKFRVIIPAVLLLVLFGVLTFCGSIANISACFYRVRGIDVSHYQGEIDWRLVRAQGMDFAFIKATEGSKSVDAYYSRNRAEAVCNGLTVGCYHFFSLESAGKTQAEYYIAIVGALSGCLPPVVDAEFYGEFKQNRPARETVVDELTDCLRTLEDFYGAKPILYSTQTFYNAYLREGFEAYPLWIRNTFFPPVQNWTFWQYSARGKLDGMNGAEQYVDLNVFPFGTDELKAMTLQK